MGRRKIEIQPITHERNRAVTFLKRKNGLFKKAYELGVLCTVDVAVIIFEERAGHHVKLYEYCSTDIDSMVRRHIQFDGEKDTRGPADFNNKQDDGGDDDDENDDDDPNKRRDNLKGQKPVRRDSGSRLPPNAKPSNTDNSGMGMGVDYRGEMSRHLSMQPPLSHLQIPGGLSNPTQSPYPSAGLPISIERHNPSGPANKKPRIDSNVPYFGMDDPGSASAHSPSYRMAPQMFSSGSGGHSGGSTNSPTTFYHPTGGMGFPRQQATGQPPGRPPSASFSTPGPPTYPGMYSQPSPLSALLPGGGMSQHAATAPGQAPGHSVPPFEALDWPVHNEQPRSAHPSTQPTAHPGAPTSAFPTRPQSQPTAGAAGGGHHHGSSNDTNWLDFLSSAAPAVPAAAPPALGSLAPPMAGDEGSRPASGAGNMSGQGRRLEDSWERGSHHSSQAGSAGSPTQAHKRPRSESIMGGAGPPLGDDSEGGARVIDNPANGTANRDISDAHSDGSASTPTGGDKKRQRWGDQ